MANERLTICLGATAADQLDSTLDAVMAPFDMRDDPEGRWDFWVIDGGGEDQGLRVRDGHDDDPRLIRRPVCGTGQPRGRWSLRCDGGPKFLLDFEFDRRASADGAASEWDRWDAFASGYPEAKSLRYFIDLYKTGPTDVWPLRARHDHVDQPVIRAVMEIDGLDPANFMWNEFNDPVGRFGPDRSEYVRRQVARVVPTGALLQTDGEWVDDASFGDGFDPSRWDRFYFFADAYLNALAGETIIVRVRFHS